MHPTAFRRALVNNSIWLLTSGTLMACSGLFILWVMRQLPFQTTIAVLFGIVGFILLIHAYRFWNEKFIGFILHIFAGIFNLTIGILIYLNLNTDFVMRLSLYVLMATFILIGVFRIIIALLEKLNFGWFYTLLAGIIDLLLINFILKTIAITPYYSLLFASGIDFAFSGMALITLGIGSYRLKNSFN